MARLIHNIFIILCAIWGNVSGQVSLVGNPLLRAHPCNGTDLISLSFEPGLPPEEENQYNLFLNEKLPRLSNVYLKFTDGAAVTLTQKGFGRIDYLESGNVFKLRTYKVSEDYVGFKVMGTTKGVIPYLKSLEVNTKEYCEHPDIGYLDAFIKGDKDTAVALSNPDSSLPKCGSVKIDFTELITHSAPTKPGEFPWHAALYQLDSHRGRIRYICGGTLVTKTAVVTAAHCTTKNGQPLNPDTLRSVLGKYYLAGGDTTIQEKEIFKVSVHDEFNPSSLIHDIAMLILKSEVEFNKYIQPACIWDATVKHEKIGENGVIVGWGFDQTDNVANELRKASIPIVSDAQCLRSHSFFSKFLTSFSFCAGYRNGTSPCNGDSGGGLVFPVDYTLSDKTYQVWHLRGIVSVSVKRKDAAVCDPHEYVIFTDVAKYVNWINAHIK